LDDVAKSSVVLDREVEIEKSREPSDPRIRCPLSGRSPRKEDKWFCTCGHEWKAAIHDQFKTGHTLEAVRDIGCSILPPAAEASLFLCANCVGRISARGHDAASDRAWR
jgi:hypothetical protein